MSLSIERFADFGLPPAILTALEALGYETPTPIQTATVPALLSGRDLIGQAQTGTGKTAAFALPLLARLDLEQQAPQALVLTPTRELAIQVAEAFQSYARHLPGFHVLPIYGGQSLGIQLRQLKRRVHVIVGTPGRVMDHLRRASLSLAHLKAMVLDEADEMLRMGFIEDVTWILEHTPASRQTALFSATMPEAIRKVARQHLRDAIEVHIQAKTATVEAVRQRYWQVSGLHKLDALTRILELEDIDAVLVFVRTKTATVELAERLEARGYACAALNGDMHQAQRERAIEQLKNKQLDVVLATDVAARGLDVPRISHVINYDIPYDVESYVNRIGRTGRAGRAGEAILFVAAREMHVLRTIERATRQAIEPMQAPTKEAIAGRRVTQFKQTLLDTLAGEDLEFFAEIVDSLGHERGLEAREIAAALAYLVQRERPLQVKEAPVPPSPKPTPEARRERQPTGGRAPRERPLPVTDVVVPRPQRPPLADHRPLPLKNFPNIDMVRYRIDIGRLHGATAKTIVGAIANEAEIENRYIGHIAVHDDFTTVDLPAGMPAEILQHLKNVRFGKLKFNLAAVSKPDRQRHRHTGSGTEAAKPRRAEHKIPTQAHRERRPR